MNLNIKSGFNRLFIVLTVLWAGYCLFVYPIQKGGEAFQKELKDTRDCYDDNAKDPDPEGLRNCISTTKDLSQIAEKSWQLKNYYRGEWPILLVVVILFPLVLYGLCRGTAATFVWVVKGFHP